MIADNNSEKGTNNRKLSKDIAIIWIKYQETTAYFLWYHV